MTGYLGLIVSIVGLSTSCDLLTGELHQPIVRRPRDELHAVDHQGKRIQQEDR